MEAPIVFLRWGRETKIIKPHFPTHFQKNATDLRLSTAHRWLSRLVKRVSWSGGPPVLVLHRPHRRWTVLEETRSPNRETPQSTNSAPPRRERRSRTLEGSILHSSASLFVHNPLRLTKSPGGCLLWPFWSLWLLLPGVAITRGISFTFPSVFNVWIYSPSFICGCDVIVIIVSWCFLSPTGPSAFGRHPGTLYAEGRPTWLANARLLPHFKRPRIGRMGDDWKREATSAQGKNYLGSLGSRNTKGSTTLLISSASTLGARQKIYVKWHNGQ